MARAVSIFVLVLIISILLVLFYQVVSVFLLPLFLAAATVLMLRPIHLRITGWCRGRRYLAAFVMTASVLIAVLVPLAVGFLIAGLEAAQIIDDLENGSLRIKLNQTRSTLGLEYPFAAECRFIESSLRQLRLDAGSGASATGNSGAIVRVTDEFERLHAGVSESRQQSVFLNPDAVRDSLLAAAGAVPGTLAYQQTIESAFHRFRDYKVSLLGGPWKLPLKELANPTTEDLRTITGQLFAITPGWIATFGGATGVLLTRTVFGLLIFVVAVFFWFADGPHIIRTMMFLSPLEDRYEEQLMAEFEILVRAVVAGSIASAISQALLSGLGFWMFGIQSVFLLMALTVLTAMVPFVGASLVWIPVSAWLAFGEGRTIAGLLMALYGAGVVSTVDNLIRPWILLERTALHPLAALLGVLGGMQALGPTGVFVGPIVVAFLQTLLTLVHREFTDKKVVELKGLSDPAVVAVRSEVPGG